MMHFHSTTLLLGALATSATAQNVDYFDSAPNHEVAWPATIQHQFPGRMVVGDLLPDLRADAVLLDGTTPVVVSAVGIHQSVFEIGTGANDLALVPNGSGDDLVIVNATGLQRLSHSSGTTFTTTTLDSGAWAGASRVVASRNGSYLVGVSSSGNVLFHDLALGSTTVGSNPPGAIHDLVAVAWGNYSRAAAVLHPSGFSIYPESGTFDPTVINSVPLALQGGVLGVISEGASATESCFLTFMASGQEFMGVIRSTSMETPTPIAPGAFAASLADIDGDGYDDLLLSSTATYDSLLFINQAPSAAPKTFVATPATAETVMLDSGAPGSWSAWPVLADVSQDGDADVVAYVAGSDAFVAFENDRVDLEDDKPFIEGAVYFFDESSPSSGDLTWHTWEGASPSFAATHVQLKILKITNDAYLNDLGPGDPGYAPQYIVQNELIALDGSGKAVSTNSLNEVDISTAYVYWCELRAVREVNNVVVESGPSTVRLFSLDYIVGQDLPNPIPVRVFTEAGELSEGEIESRVISPNQVPIPPPPAPPSVPL